MPAKVVDASVVAAWCFREARASEALELLRGSDLYAPLLLAYELTSVARSKAVAYPGRESTFAEALRTALALPFHWSEVDHPAVLRLALRAGISTYDASYLFLSRALGVTLATFDERLQRASESGN